MLQRTAILQGIAVCDEFRTPCLFVDVANGIEVGKHNHDTSYKNEEEANCAVSIVKHLMEKGVMPQSIGIITFYSSQVVLLKDKAKSLIADSHGVPLLKISTVDGFQGMERDIIILCTTRTCKSAGFLRDARRINVAVTRAKHNLYVLGKKEKLLESNTDLSLLIRHYEENEGCSVVDSATLLAML